jgi:hypothetical protein
MGNNRRSRTHRRNFCPKHGGRPRNGLMAGVELALTEPQVRNMRINPFMPIAARLGKFMGQRGPGLNLHEQGLRHRLDMGHGGSEVFKLAEQFTDILLKVLHWAPRYLKAKIETPEFAPLNIRTMLAPDSLITGNSGRVTPLDV